MGITKFYFKCSENQVFNWQVEMPASHIRECGLQAHLQLTANAHTLGSSGDGSSGWVPATHTLDLDYVQNSRFQSQPSLSHWGEVER